MKYKKWVLVFFMLVIFMPMLVSVSLLLWQQIIQYQMMEQLEAKNLTTIIIKKNSLKWSRIGKEIEVDGKLFDVEDISIKDGDYIIKGLYDEKEEMLLQTMKKSHQSPGDQPLHFLVSKLLSAVLFIENVTGGQGLTFSGLSKKYCLFKPGNFLSYSPALAGPPPKC